MCTLRTRHEGLLGVTAHEYAHSWFQQLQMNQSTVGWTKDLLHFGRFWTGRDADKSRKPIFGCYTGYFSMVNSGKEPQGTHADRFDENRVCTA
jgi:hypothetical protein